MADLSNFRELNDVMLRNIQDILDKLGSSRCFSALDCAS